MIVPMIKYTFVLHHTDCHAFIQKLQELGIVDTKRSNKPIDARSSALLEEINRVGNICKQLQKIKVTNPQSIDREYSAEHILQCTQQLLTDKEEATLRISKLRNEIEAARPWQIWRQESLDRLESLRLTPHFYVLPEKKWNPEWEMTFPIFPIHQKQGTLYFVVLEQEGIPFHFPGHETKIPLASVDLLEAELENVERQIFVAQQELEKYALLHPRLTLHRERLIEQLDLYLAGKGSETAVEDTLSIVTAFVPQPQQKCMDDFLDREHQLYLCEKAQIEDNPPIKLKNNRFARLFEPIGDMFMPPLYNELDVTAFFAPCYMLFFGFCLGDIGYGLSLLLIGGIAKFFLPKMKSILSLVQFLGVGSMLIPLLSGTFFGFKLHELFTIDDKFFFEDLDMFWLAIAIGGVHIIYAKIILTIDSFKRKGLQEGLAPLGWFLVLTGGALFAAQSVLSLPIPLLIISIFLYLGSALILFFTSLSKKFYLRPILSLSCIMDIPGLFGDLLSYIRLFGLGAAGGILGFVVNTVGGMVWNVKIPVIGYLIGGIIFLVGHVAVLALSSLGALVHPMRLTFVEFYKNVGFTGGGRPYKPLSKNVY